MLLKRYVRTYVHNYTATFIIYWWVYIQMYICIYKHLIHLQLLDWLFSTVLNASIDCLRSTVLMRHYITMKYL